MKNFYTSTQLTVILLMIHFGLNAQTGQGTYTVQQQGIKVVGEKIFSSPNPKISQDVLEPLNLDYSQVFKGFFKLEPGMHGITGTIDKPGGKITLEVFAYTPSESDGIQKLTLSNGTKVPRMVYSCYIDKSTEVGKTPRTFQAQTTLVDYGYLYDRKQPDKITAYGKATSTDLKTLGAGCKNGFYTSDCVSPFWSNLHWIASGIKANFIFVPKDQLTTYQCADIAENYYGGTQPVIIRLTVKDATLEDFAVPAMSAHGISALNMELKTIKRIKKVNITILEPSKVNHTVDFYKRRLTSTIQASNRYFTDRYGKVKPKAVTAEIGNSGIVIKDVDVVIKKTTRAGYDFYNEAQTILLVQDFGYTMGDSKKRINMVYAVTKSTDGKSLGSVAFTAKTGNNIDDLTFIIYDFNFLLSPTERDLFVSGPPSVTFAHEVGHYLGLEHTFKGGCKGGDGIDDTPPCEGEEWYVDPATGRMINNPCDNAPIQCGQRRQIENMMDYGPCSWFFTKGQIAQMNKVIATAPDLYVTEQVAAENELPVLNIKITDLRNAASGKVNFISETVANDQGTMNEEAIVATPSSDFTFYPNPTEGPLHLDYAMPNAGIGQLSIRDLLGKIVYEEKLSFVAGRNSYHLEHLKLFPNTHYILRFESEAMTRTARLISK